MKPENHASSAQKADDDPAVGREDSKHVPNWTNILDVAAKLIGAFAVVAATFVANRYQSSMTATNLLVQREQADSNLRAGMFRDLIGPIVGPGNDKGDIDPDRERLLVELLALNFHEHFELKPLMVHVDHRLAHGENSEMDQAQRQDARESLRSVARRVLQRQLSVLSEADDESSLEQQVCVYDLQIDERKPQKTTKETLPPKESIEETSPLNPCSRLKSYFNDLISIESPNGLYTLAFTINTPRSWESQSFDVSARISRKWEDDKHKTFIADNDFHLTWFDFPFSDNTLLADGTRFSLVIDQVERFEFAGHGGVPNQFNRVNLKLVWFPQDYFAAQERPTNYHQLREKLGLTVKE